MHTKGKQLEEVQRSRILSMFAVGLLLTLAPVARPVVFSSLRGIVHDPDHRPVAGAVVTVKSASSDYSKRLTTDADGTFELVAFPIGEYQVTVTQQGFRLPNKKWSSLRETLRFCIFSSRLLRHRRL